MTNKLKKFRIKYKVKTGRTNYKLKKIKILSGNMLKIIGAIAMVIDHIGLRFFPDYIIFRIIGRISFPIFAFMIAEGCRYTKNKLRYFITMLSIGIAVQLIFSIYTGILYFSIFITFSISIILSYSLEYFKNSVFSNDSIIKKYLSFVLFASLVVAAFIFNLLFSVDYGFLGCLLPVLANITYAPNKAQTLKMIDIIPIRLIFMGVGLVLMSLDIPIKLFSLLSIPILLLYSEKRGKYRMKYFFYAFYPAHILIIEGIYLLIG